ncbi:DUF4331 family protein [Nonomuraea sp. NPDC003804]|uniref:DUF4331 family protein n=1 Tax=Nonomuraea sp. NPDC003804 TaxID=3154547 RepID=UPI0033B77101
MSHHLSGPNLRPPSGDARLDLTDVFAFRSPRAPESTVLIMDVNSFSFDPTHGPHLHPDAVYRLNIDNDGDTRADVAFSFVFSAPREGRQTVTVFHGTGEAARSWEAAGDQVLTDVRIGMVTDGRVPDDGIGPHTDLLPDFPYLGTPHPQT